MQPDRSLLWLSASALLVALVSLVSALTPGKLAGEVKAIRADLDFVNKNVMYHRRLLDEGMKEANARLAAIEEKLGKPEPKTARE